MVVKQKIFPDTETQIYVRDKHDLGDVLSARSTNDNKRNQAFFSTIDFVFMEGDSALLPWSSHFEKALTLLRMCVECGKKCFVSGGGLANCVVMLSSDRIHRSIIDGTEHAAVHTGADVPKLLVELQTSSQLVANDYLVDSSTGDVYQCKREIDEEQLTIIERGNLGMHREKHAEDNHLIGKFVLKSSVHRNKPQYGEKLLVGKRNEELVYFDKRYNCHYLLRDIPHQIRVNVDSRTWNVHAFCNSDASQALFRFEIMAESEKSKASVIRMRANQNMFVLFFQVETTYAETVDMLSNFFTEGLVKMASDVRVLSVNSRIGGSSLPVKQYTYSCKQSHLSSMNNNYNNSSSSGLLLFNSDSSQSPSRLRQYLNASNEENGGTYKISPLKIVSSISNTTNINQHAYLKLAAVLSSNNNSTSNKNAAYKTTSNCSNRSSPNNQMIRQVATQQGRQLQCVSPVQTRKIEYEKRHTGSLSRQQSRHDGSELIDTRGIDISERTKASLSKAASQIREVALVKDRTTFNKNYIHIENKKQQSQSPTIMRRPRVLSKCPTVVSKMEEDTRIQNDRNNNIRDANGGDLDFDCDFLDRIIPSDLVCLGEYQFKDDVPQRWRQSPWKKSKSRKDQAEP